MQITTDDLTRIGDLTRRYAKYSRSQAGLSAAWGGLCLTLLAGLTLGHDLARYAADHHHGGTAGFWRFLLGLGESNVAQRPLLSSAALALPIFWLAGRAWVQRHVYELHGVVTETGPEIDVGSRRAFRVLEIGMAGLVMLGGGIHLAFAASAAGQAPGVLLAVVVALLPPILGPRMISLPDRQALILLCLGSATVLSGGPAESQLVIMLAYAVLGSALIVSGIRAHARFRNVKRELEALPADTISAPSGVGEPMPEDRSFAPRISPRDGTDLAIGLLMAAIQIALLFMLPSLAVFMLTQSGTLGEYTFLGELIVFVSFTVEKVTIGRDGMRFHRIFGSPRFLAWEQIAAVEAVGRRELILHGWLWPLFPPREMTACFSSVGHYRISWDGGYCYFPPHDPRQFEECVAQGLGHRDGGRASPDARQSPAQP